ncbi:MAG: hypothetical protein AAFY03_08980 [Pseudomonadota bacterium]
MEPWHWTVLVIGVLIAFAVFWQAWRRGSKGGGYFPPYGTDANNASQAAWLSSGQQNDGSSGGASSFSGGDGGGGGGGG